jgi:hypothetical protein
VAAGRPTNWSKEIEQQAWDYANGGWKQEGHMIPSVVGLVKVIGRSKTTLYDWAKDEDKEFSAILASINDLQQFVLIDQGLAGKFNSNITKLVLGKHGYHDRMDNRVALTEVTQEEWLDTLDDE